MPPLKPTLTLATLALLLSVPDALPQFKDYKVLDWRTIPSVLDFLPRSTSIAPVEEEMLRLRPDKDPASYQTHKLTAPEGSLDRFYEALHRTEQKLPGAVTRILHYGDSPTTADMITGDVRRLLQQQFGDAGHGFCLMAKPWAWYDHSGVRLESGGWTIDPASQAKVRDGRFGIGGVSFRGSEGAWTRWTLKDGSHTRLAVSFLKQPGGGTFSVEAEGAPLGTIDTSTAESAVFAVPPLSRRFEVRVLRGAVRLFGATFDKPGPGVSYDSLGLNGGYVSVLARMFDERHWAGALRGRQPHLVIINYGTNESAYAPFVDKVYAKELAEIVRRIREAAPGASILVMSPM
ncbi:MAG: GDSL-type esterase/lipase family protein, partial [Bryobacteraceae bacterium]